MIRLSLAVKTFGYGSLDTLFCAENKIDIDALAARNGWFVERGMLSHSFTVNQIATMSWDALMALPVGETRQAIKVLAKDAKKKNATGKH